MCVFDRTWLDKVDFLLVLDAGIKDLVVVELEFVESFLVPSHPNFGNVVKHKDTLTVRVPTRVRGSKLSETRGILSGEHHEKSARDLRLLCDRFSNIFLNIWIRNYGPQTIIVHFTLSNAT